jgi:hypothetical protein
LLFRLTILPLPMGRKQSGEDALLGRKGRWGLRPVRQPKLTGVPS